MGDWLALFHVWLWLRLELNQSCLTFLIWSLINSKSLRPSNIVGKWNLLKKIIVKLGPIFGVAVGQPTHATWGVGQPLDMAHPPRIGRPSSWCPRGASIGGTAAAQIVLKWRKEWFMRVFVHEGIGDCNVHSEGFYSCEFLHHSSRMLLEFLPLDDDHMEQKLKLSQYGCVN